MKLQESILDSIKDKLSPDLWNDMKIKPSAKSFILNRLKAWLKGITSKEIQHLFLLGSMAGYQYSSVADVDVNFVIDVSEKRLEEIAKILPNGQNLPGTNHPINYYISNEVKDEWDESGPVYDILNDKWISKPTKENSTEVFTNYRAVVEVARFFISGLENAISEYNTDVANYETYKSYLEEAPEEDKNDIKKLMEQKLYEIIADIDGVYIAKHVVKALRKEAFDDKDGIEIITKIRIKDSNTSINNLIYKYLERLNYFDKIEKVLDSREKWENETKKVT